MKPLILFGSGKIAEVLLYFFQNHSDRKIIACTVDRDHLLSSEWHGLPLVAFDEVEQQYPPTEYDMFVALGYQEMNSLRANTCARARALGYTLASYVHPDSGLPTDCIYGDNCFIMNQVHIHPRVQIGNNVFIWSGSMIGHHSSIGDNCWLTSCANVSGVVTMGKNCFLAVNATVAHGITIGDNCFIGANALVVKTTQPSEAYLAENTKPFRLNSHQFLRMSRFAEL
ncbi:MAG: NeuD/PglB/VioB family sugar acetyltransferase [Proteobacteria bacterium]|nr:NeuD/PglB/VioB family sugar acetyltransferase [Pseudomonadota bacterium]